MASPTLTCPHCSSVLRPAAPVPAGKKVRCPKCKETFTAGGEPEVPKAKKPVLDDDGEEESGSTYGIATDPDAPPPEDPKDSRKNKKNSKKKEGGKPEINYAPDTSLKDFRGPAIQILTKPCNNMMFHCTLVLLLSIGSMVLAGWAFVFQERLLSPAESLKEFLNKKLANKDDNAAKWKSRQEDLKLDKLSWPIPLDKAGKKMWEPEYGKTEMSKEEDEAAKEFMSRSEKPTRIAWLLASIFIVVWTFMLLIGTVKIINLESYRWGVTTAVMCFLPVNCLTFLTFIWKQWENMDFFYFPVIFLPATSISSILFGIWFVICLKDERVKAGFRFKGTDAQPD